MSTPLRPHDPREVGPYELLGRLGAGGMGTVYLGRAHDGRLVAIKVIQTALADDPDFRARFRSEVNRARQVPPFCTAEVLDADVDGDQPYLVVEYVDGPTLTQVVQENGPLSAGGLQGVALGVATALAAIHSAGVIHRDLKPQNVLFALGNPKVIDFGIARAYEATSQHTRTGEMVGTVAYMAPERLDPQDHEVSYPADIFPGPSWSPTPRPDTRHSTPALRPGQPCGSSLNRLISTASRRRCGTSSRGRCRSNRTSGRPRASWWTYWSAAVQLLRPAVTTPGAPEPWRPRRCRPTGPAGPVSESVVAACSARAAESGQRPAWSCWWHWGR
ncbi:serine/threonine-protein kinase [Micromonospora sp. M12]